MKNLHTTQLEILQKIMYSSGLKYSNLKPLDMEGSKFTFHLDKLLKEDLITKIEGKYQLTALGKELSGRMDLGDTKVEMQAKISVFIVCVSDGKYLLYTRHKTPFYGYQGFPTGKVKKGEAILEAAKRELKEETGLTGEPKLFAIRHYRIYDKTKNLLEDKIYFACKITGIKGKLKSGPEGKYSWVEKEKIWDYLKNPVVEIKEIIELVESDGVSFGESRYTTEGF